MSRPVTLAASTPEPVAVTPEPTTVISRQPIRDASKPSANAIVELATIGDASGASYVQTLRIVDSPPLPGGNVRPAPVSASRAAVPSTVRLRARPTDTQVDARAAAVSAGDSVPSPSRSKPWLAWNVGISASSMTTSSTTRDGSRRIPA